MRSVSQSVSAGLQMATVRPIRSSQNVVVNNLGVVRNSIPTATEAVRLYLSGELPKSVLNPKVPELVKTKSPEEQKALAAEEEKALAAAEAEKALAAEAAHGLEPESSKAQEVGPTTSQDLPLLKSQAPEAVKARGVEPTKSQAPHAPKAPAPEPTKSAVVVQISDRISKRPSEVASDSVKQVTALQSFHANLAKLKSDDQRPQRLLEVKV